MQLLQSSVQLSPSSFVAPSLSTQSTSQIWCTCSCCNLQSSFPLPPLLPHLCLRKALPRFGAHAVVAIFSPAFPFLLCCPISVYAKHFPDLVHMQLLQSSVQLSPSSFVAPSLSTQ